MRNLAELNMNEGGRPIKRVPPSDDMVNDFEHHFQLKIPAPLVTLLRYANGGHPELSSYFPTDSVIAANWAVNRFYHVGEDRSNVSNLWAATEEWQRILGKSALPFARDGFGNQFFLDLRSSPPSVKVCIHDDRFRIVDLAPSFEAFIDGLAINPECID